MGHLLSCTKVQCDAICIEALSFDHFCLHLQFRNYPITVRAAFLLVVAEGGTAVPLDPIRQLLDLFCSTTNLLSNAKPKTRVIEAPGFSLPQGICALTESTAIICDSLNKKLHVMNIDTGIVDQTFHGNGLDRVVAIAVVGPGLVAFTEHATNTLTIMRLASNKIVRKVSGFLTPMGLCSVADDTVVVADAGNSVVRVVDIHTGEILRTIGNVKGNERDQFSYPYDVAATGSDFVVVTDLHNHRVVVVAWAAGEVLSHVDTADRFPRGVTSIDRDTVAIACAKSIHFFRWFESEFIKMCPKEDPSGDLNFIRFVGGQLVMTTRHRPVTNDRHHGHRLIPALLVIS